jgi:hypothetical protein
MKTEGFVSYKKMENLGRRVHMDMWVMLTCPKCGEWFLFNNDTKVINFSDEDGFQLTPADKLPPCKCGKGV